VGKKGTVREAVTEYIDHARAAAAQHHLHTLLRVSWQGLTLCGEENMVHHTEHPRHQSLGHFGSRTD